MVVHHEQGLRGDRRRDAFAVGRAGVGEVERLKHIVEAAADHRQIDRTAVHVINHAAGLGGRVDISVVVLGHERSAHGRVELAADGQDRVADRLGFEPAPACPPVQAVFGINTGSGRIEAGAHLIRLRKHDQSVHRLDRPARGDEAPRQPVEQVEI